MSNIKLIKLITDEELIAEVLPSSDAVCKLRNPVRVVVMPNKIDPKSPNIGFGPWAEFSDDKEIEIDKRHILAIMTPVKQFAEQYSSMFSKIVTPQSTGLILPN